MIESYALSVVYLIFAIICWFFFYHHPVERELMIKDENQSTIMDT